MLMEWAWNPKDGSVWLSCRNQPEDAFNSRAKIERCKSFVWWAEFENEKVYGNTDTLRAACEAVQHVFHNKGFECGEIPKWADTYTMLHKSEYKIVEVWTVVRDGTVAMSVNGCESVVDLERESVTSNQQLAKMLVERFGDLKHKNIRFRVVENSPHVGKFYVMCPDGLTVRNNSVCKESSFCIRKVDVPKESTPPVE